MKVLLTGGTGFLGKNVARALADAGHELRVLVRPNSNRADLPDNATFVPGDVTDRGSLFKGARGCDAVLHMAALVKMWDPDPSRFDAVNVGGLRNAIDAASQTGARLLYTSSFIAIGPTSAAPVDESQVHPADRYRNAYERTKAIADGIAREAAEHGAEIVMVYPGVVYGPGEVTDGNIVVKMVVDQMKGRFAGIVGPGDRLWSYAYVDDVARGHVLALEKGRRGERYFLCGDNVSMNDLFATLERVAGVPAPTRHIPYAVATLLGATLYGWAEMTGHPPLLTHEVVGVFKEHWSYSSRKAAEELGYAPRSLEEGLRRTVEWLRNEGLA
jgi:NAD+-dependent farnesol dehydrogenase